MAKSRAQQAAIAISMKKAGKKPKQMKKGGKAKTLSKVSKQLAKASKMHASQSKKVGKLAEMMQEGGYPKSDPNVFMKSMGYYQGGGIKETPMYGANVIPGSQDTSAVVYTEADPAKLKQLEQELEQAQESTKYMDEAEAKIAEEQAKIQSIESGLETGVQALDKAGVFNKLKEKGAQKAADKLGQEALIKGTTLAGGVSDDALKALAPKLFEKGTTSALQGVTSSLPSSLANFSTPALTTTPLSQLGTTASTSLVNPALGQQGANLLNTGAAAGAGASKGLIGGIGPGGIGAIASIAGEGLKMASDDQDATTMNVGESIGSGLSGVGTGIGAAMTTAALMGSSLGPLGTAAGAIGGAVYGLGKGLIQRKKAREEMAEAERKQQKEVELAQSKRKLEALKSRQYSGFDFGSDIRQSGGYYQIGGGVQMPASLQASIKQSMSKPMSEEDRIRYGSLQMQRDASNYLDKEGTLAGFKGSKEKNDLVKTGKFIAKEGILDKALHGLGRFSGVPGLMLHPMEAGASTVRDPYGVPMRKLLVKNRNGGVKLPGGMAKPIPGSDAIEFKGRSHEQGGIMVDPNTEVEGNETMDQVTMKNGGKSDYFFSQHLKMGGKSFAQRHKDILKNGGSQKDIDALAKLQEKKAGRNPNDVKLGAGGYYQEGGPDDIMATVEIPEVEPVFLRTIPTIDPMAIPTELETIPEDQIYLQDSDKDKDTNLTDLEKKALKRLNRDVPGLASAAGAAQLIAPAYAFFKKDRVAEQMGAPGRIKAPTLDRVSFNAERAANAANNRAMNRFIETSGIGPAGIIAKMAAYGRKQKGDINIAKQEARINTQIANREAEMAQQANIRNIANAMQADQINTQLRERQLAASEDRRLGAIDAFTERTAGLAGDLMSYKATERLARATGDMGIYERDRLRNFLKNQINPRTGKPYTNADIAEVFNKRFAQPTATEEDKKEKE